jgi:hypothetical protein
MLEGVFGLLNLMYILAQGVILWLSTEDGLMEVLRRPSYRSSNTVVIIYSDPWNMEVFTCLGGNCKVAPFFVL